MKNIRMSKPMSRVEMIQVEGGHGHGKGKLLSRKIAVILGWDGDHDDHDDHDDDHDHDEGPVGFKGNAIDAGCHHITKG